MKSEGSFVLNMTKLHIKQVCESPFKVAQLFDSNQSCIVGWDRPSLAAPSAMWHWNFVLGAEWGYKAHFKRGNGANIDALAVKEIGTY